MADSLVKIVSQKYGFEVIHYSKIQDCRGSLNFWNLYIYQDTFNTIMMKALTERNGENWFSKYKLERDSFIYSQNSLFRELEKNYKSKYINSSYNYQWYESSKHIENSSYWINVLRFLVNNSDSINIIFYASPQTAFWHPKDVERKTEILKAFFVDRMEIDSNRISFREEKGKGHKNMIKIEMKR